MTEKVQVVARIRPLQRSDSQPVVVPLDERRICVANRRVYHVDRVFSSDDTTEFVFYDSVVSLVDKFLAGYNATVLAYGQTGSGKTFTMSGITPLVLRYVVERMGGSTGQLSFQCVEVYGEALRDLLTSDPAGSAKHLQLHDGDGGGGNGAAAVVVVGAARVRARGVAEVEEIIEHSTRMRTTGATNMNQHSSRSHSIFTVFNHERQSKLNLVDLAGSERNKKTQNVGVRFRESVAINGGLLALGNVIRALSRNHFQHPETPRHVPYRGSKLTRLLQDALGGNSTTLLIACVACDAVNGDETTRTLQYSARAMHILNEPLPQFDERVATAAAAAAAAEAENVGRAPGSSSHGKPLGEPTFSAAEVAELRQRVAELEGQVRRCREELKNDEVVFAQQIEGTRLLLEENESLKRRVAFLEGRHVPHSPQATAATPAPRAQEQAPAAAGTAAVGPRRDGMWEQQQQRWIPDPVPPNPSYVRDALELRGIAPPSVHPHQGVVSGGWVMAADRGQLLPPTNPFLAAVWDEAAEPKEASGTNHEGDGGTGKGASNGGCVWGAGPVTPTLAAAAAEREEQLSLLAKEALYYQNSNSELRRRLRTVLAMYETQQREAAMLRVEMEQLHELLEGSHRL